MLNPSEIYDVDPEVAAQVEARTVNGAGPVLVHAVRGFVDAGNAGQLAAEHLVDELPTTRLATFDVDQLLDYRSRRPSMVFVEDHWESYEEPSLALHLLRDEMGTQFLMLAGPEPDVQWERFIAAVTGLIDRFGVRLTVFELDPHGRAAHPAGQRHRPRHRQGAAGRP